MVSVHLLIRISTEHGTGGHLPTRLQSRGPSPMAISNHDPPQSSAKRPSTRATDSKAAIRSLRDDLLSCFHRGRRESGGLYIPGTAIDRTGAAMTEPTALKPELDRPPLAQEISRTNDPDVEQQHSAWLENGLASLAPRERARSSSSDDAESIYTVFLPEGDRASKERHRYVILAAYDSVMGRPLFFWATVDTGAYFSVISYDLARILAPEGIDDDFAGFGTETLTVPGNQVTVHGPTRIKFWLRNPGSRTFYNAPFYVVSRHCNAEGIPEALLDSTLVEQLGLVVFPHNLTVEVKARE